MLMANVTDEAAGWAAIGSFTGLFFVVLTTFIRDRRKALTEAAAAYKEQTIEAVAQRDRAIRERDAAQQNREAMMMQRFEDVRTIADLRAENKLLRGDLE